MATITSTPARFYAGTLPAVATSYWTTPSAETDVLTSINAMNLTTIAQTFTVQVAGTYLAYQLSIPPQSITVLDVKVVMNTGESISLAASNASAVTMFISGVKVTSS
jgi:hypothetical protein